MNRQFVFWGAWVALFLIHGTCFKLQAKTIDPNQYYTWGISNDELFIPPGQIITEAVLTIHGITNPGESENDILYIYLIDNPPTDFKAYVENIAADIFGNPGVILEPPYQDFIEGREELTYTLSQLDDELSSVWRVFDYPFDFILADSSIVTYSSSLLTIIDYAGTGTSFGFGFDPNGLNGYGYDGVSLEITIESYLGPPEKSLLTFTYGIINWPPVLAIITDKYIAENAQLTFSITATDADGDAVIYSATALPTGAIFAGDTFTWTPTYNQAGTYQVTFIASDGQDTDNETITITVYNINTAPVLDAIENKSVMARKMLIFSINAADPDGDSINYSVQNLPEGAAFAGNTFTWTPWYDQTGSHAVTFIASDGSSDSSKTITITVMQPELASWYEAWLKHLGLM